MTSPVRTWLRVEGLAVVLLALLLYREQGGGWVLFAVLLFVPDLSMVGYLAGARVGAVAYNLVHTYTGPLLLGTLSVVAASGLGTSIALIWGAHIGLDRTLGYGLKLPSGFRETHLGEIGGAAAAAPASGRRRA